MLRFRVYRRDFSLGGAKPASRLVAILVVSASLAATIGGCGGASSTAGGTASSNGAPASSNSAAASNGVAAKSATAILTAASSAIRGAKSVHVAGSVENGGSPITLDLDLAAGKGGRGRLSENGWSVQLIVIKQVAYLNGGDAFWRHFGGNFLVQLLHRKWLRAPATGKLGSLAELTDLQKLFSKFVSGTHHGALTKGGTSTVNGQRVVALKGTDGTLYVATKGKPYIVEASKAGPQGGHLSFDRYDQPVSLSAPSHAITAP